MLHRFRLLREHIRYALLTSRKHGKQAIGYGIEHKLIYPVNSFSMKQRIPIAVESFPGNTLDHLTLKTALSKNIDDMGYSRFILIADCDICNYPNILHSLDNGNGYIMAKSLLKSTAKEREWAYSNDDFIVESHVHENSITIQGAAHPCFVMLFLLPKIMSTFFLFLAISYNQKREPDASDSLRCNPKICTAIHYI